jgi:hypothetical protein
MHERLHDLADCALVRAKPSRFAALATVLLLAACGPRDASFNPSNFQVRGVIAPRDVAVPNDAVDGDVAYDGLYVGGPNLLSCCWIAPHARLLVRKRAPARTLVAGFWTPDQPFFRTHPQTVTLTFDGTHAPAARLKLAPSDLTAFHLAVPRMLRDKTGLIPITLDTSVTYIPALDSTPSHGLTHDLFVLLHLARPQASKDMRPLGTVLMYLYFE